MSQHRKNLYLFTLSSFFLLFSSQIGAHQYIVKPRLNINKYSANELHTVSHAALKITNSIPDLNLLKIESLDPLPETIAFLTEYFDAEYVVENIKLYAFYQPGDPRRGEQWALDKIEAPLAWDLTLGSQDVVVAVVDTGIDKNHEDLKANIWTNTDEVAGNGKDDDNNGFIDDVHGWDFKGNDHDPQDETSSLNPGHGTHCAGIIGAACDNNVGVCGISPKVSLMPLRFLGSDGSGDLFSAIRAIEYAANNGAHIISASFGANIPEAGAQPLVDAIKKAEAKGVIFVAAAGNESRSNDSTSIYPANAGTPHMIAVAASNKSDEKPYWSNFGRKVHLAAPGQDILSTIPAGYKELSGTSMATPLVAGSVALLKSLDMSLTGAQARSILQSTGDTVNIETESMRRINAYKAIEAVKQKKLTLVPATLTLAADETFSFSAWGGVAPYRFRSLNEEVATIDETGHFVAKSNGDVVIEVTDANNNTAQSVSIRIQDAPPPGSTCPINNEFLCLIACIIKPDLPWCKDLELPVPWPNN